MESDSSSKSSLASLPRSNAVLGDPSSALAAARNIGRGEIPHTDRSALLAAAEKLPPGPVRDLFEGYFPADPTARKLGSSPRPKSILSLRGDATRGESLFWSMAVNCGSCHKIGDRGAAVGPELSTIGKLRTRQELLESLLEPSRRIDPKFAAFVARTTDGSVLTGLVVKRDASGVVLRDAQNKERALAAENIEQVQPSLKSLMPDGQAAGLTAQQAADLLEYLAIRR